MKSNITFLKPEHLAHIRSLSLRAQAIVEGVMAGMHKSPYHGFSAEFREYRPYQNGESAARIDWRVYAKTDKSAVRLYDDETNLFATILLDKSASMKFKYGSAMSKHDFGRTLAASLAWILIKQRDAVGLFAYDNLKSLYMPPKSTHAQLSAMLSHLDTMEPSGTTCTGAAIEQLAQTLKRRGLCIVISDLLDDQEQIMRGLRHLRFKRQDVMLVWLLDPMEVCFDKKIDRCELRDMENGKSLQMDGETAREFFKTGMNEHKRFVESTCTRFGIDCETVITDEPFAKALMRILEKRRRLF
jgi:uncharacterized protein (DUF58 family)